MPTPRPLGAQLREALEGLGWAYTQTSRTDYRLDHNDLSFADFQLADLILAGGHRRAQEAEHTTISPLLLAGDSRLTCPLYRLDGSSWVCNETATHRERHEHPRQQGGPGRWFYLCADHAADHQAHPGSTPATVQALDLPTAPPRARPHLLELPAAARTARFCDIQPATRVLDPETGHPFTVAERRDVGPWWMALHGTCEVGGWPVHLPGPWDAPLQVAA